MKRATFILTLCLLSFFAKGQFYGINIQEVCWQIGSTDSSLYVVTMSAAATTKPTFLHYFRMNGTTPTAVTVSGGTVRAGHCGDFPRTSEANFTNYISSVLANDTIAANSVHSVVVNNFALTTHDITVDGTSLRLYPGERYKFVEWYDPVERRWHYNPQIIITSGTLNVNNLRVTKFTKP